MRPRIGSLLAVLVWAAIAIVVPMQRQLELGDNFLFRAIAAVSIFGILLGHAVKPPLVGVWIGGAATILVSVFLSAQPGYAAAGFNAALALLVVCTLTPFVLAYYVRNVPYFVGMVGGAFLLMQSISSVVALLQYVGINIFGVFLDFGRSRGLAGHPNLLGMMGAIASVAFLYLMVRARRPASRMFAGIALLLNVLAIVSAGSISGLVTFVVGAAVLLVALRVFFRAAIVLLVLGGIGLMLSYIPGSFVSNIIDSVAYRLDVVTGVDDTGGAASIAVRAQTYEWAWLQIADRFPLGVGFDDAHAGSFNGITVVHNYLLRGWAQGGFLYFVWLVVFTLSVTITAFRRSRTIPMAALSFALSTMIFVYAFSSAFFTQLQYWLPLAFAVALLATPLASATSPGSSEEPTTSGVRSARSRVTSVQPSPRDGSADVGR